MHNIAVRRDVGRTIIVAALALAVPVAIAARLRADDETTKPAVEPSKLSQDLIGTDAADYIVWRDTLGSTTNLAADAMPTVRSPRPTTPSGNPTSANPPAAARPAMPQSRSHESGVVRGGNAGDVYLASSDELIIFQICRVLLAKQRALLRTENCPPPSRSP
jgi:hypothetical protein